MIVICRTSLPGKRGVFGVRTVIRVGVSLSYITVSGVSRPGYSVSHCYIMVS
jgi:hypothetical protein